MRRLMLSGWAQPADALKPVAPEALAFDYSAYATPQESFAGLAAFRDAEEVIGWSTGGQLALRAIAAGVLAPRKLTLIGVPYQFVSGQGILGMDPLTFEQFRTNFATNPARTKNRFHALVAKGDEDASRVLGQLTHHPEVENTARWLPWLDELGRHSLSGTRVSHVPQTLIVHGMSDAIVPHGQAQLLANLLPNATVRLWENVGHAPHLHNPEKLRAEMARMPEVA